MLNPSFPSFVHFLFLKNFLKFFIMAFRSRTLFQYTILKKKAIHPVVELNLARKIFYPLSSNEGGYKANGFLIQQGPPLALKERRRYGI